MKTNNLKDQRRGPFYFDKHNMPYVTVTNVLGIIDKPALRYWFGKQVFLAMVANPNMGEKEALASPYQSTNSALTRGITVHTIVEAYKHTKEQLDVVEEYRGYAKAFYSFIEANGVEILEQERTVFSHDYGYAGTLDLLLKFKGEKLPFVIDVKTGKDIYNEAFLQTAAYAKALPNDVGGIGVLLLKEDGSYKFALERDIDKKFKAFRAALYLWNDANEELIKTVTEKAKQANETTNK